MKNETIITKKNRYIYYTIDEDKKEVHCYIKDNQLTNINGYLYRLSGYGCSKCDAEDTFDVSVGKRIAYKHALENWHNNYCNHIETQIRNLRGEIRQLEAIKQYRRNYLQKTKIKINKKICEELKIN